MANELDRNKSRIILASRMGCTVHDLKKSVFDKFISFPVSREEMQRLVEKYSAAKRDQGILYDMHPDDTPAGLMVDMMKEFISAHTPTRKTESQFFMEVAKKDPDLIAELILASGRGDTARIEELLSDKPGFLEAFVESMPDNEIGFNSNALLDEGEFITKLYRTALDTIEIIDRNRKLSNDGKFEALLFITTIIFLRKDDIAVQFDLLKESFVENIKNYIVKNKIRLDTSSQIKFISDRFLFFSMEVFRARNSKYILDKAFVALYEAPLSIRHEFNPISNSHLNLLSSFNLDLSRMVEFTTFIKNNVIQYVNSRINDLISEYE